MDEILLLAEHDRTHPDDPCGEPQPIGRVLTELFARYQERFPGIQIEVVETAGEVAW